MRPLSLVRWLGIAALVLIGCGRAGDPFPGLAPSPSPTIPPTPTPIPTPTQWPIAISPLLPAEVQAELHRRLAGDPRWRLVADPGALHIAPARPDAPVRLGVWIYTLVAPFPTVTDVIPFEALRAHWRGQDTLPGPILVATEPWNLFAAGWGARRRSWPIASGRSAPRGRWSRSTGWSLG